MRAGLPLAALALGALGCGDNGNGVGLSASGVFPPQGFIGRDTRVEISGDLTTWTDGTKVSFGDNVTVSHIAVASPTSLFADITIEPTAQPGFTDVTVTDQDGNVVSLTQAFELDTALAVNVRGSVAQGSFGHFTVSNLDIAHPFDVSASDASGQNGVVLASSYGVTFKVDSVNAFEASGRVFFDIDAEGGAMTATTKHADGTTYLWVLPDLVVARRSPLTLGDTAGGTIESPFGSELFRFTTGDLTFTDWSISGRFGTTKYSVLPASGKWADAFAQQLSLFGTTFQFADLSQLTEQALGFFLVVEDDTGTSGYDYALSANVTALATLGDSSGATAAAAEPVTSGKFVTGGEFTSATDEHWFQLTNLAPGATIRVVTDGDASNDAIVKLYVGVPADASAPFAVSADSGFHEDLSATATVGGTVSVLLQWSDGTFASPFDPTNSHYSAVFIVE